jgi:hypothetical protein
VQIGEGQLAGALTFIGILLGSWLAVRQAEGQRRRSRKQAGASAASPSTPDDWYSPIAAE